MIEVLAKGLPKNIDEATIRCWYFEEGDHVSEGDDLVELATEDSTIVISVPATGVLAEVFFDEGETVQRDELLCMVDDAEELDEKDDDDEEDDDKAEKKDKDSDDEEDDDF